MPEQVVDLVDPNVRIPAAVTRAGQRADQIIASMQPPAPGDDAAPAAPDAGVTATVTPPADPPADPPAAAAPPAAPDPAAPGDDDENNQTWKHRYHAMEGRFKQAMNTINGMQGQMRELGDEVLRLQQFIGSSGGVATAPQGQPTQKLLTDRDREVYGDELLDVVQRAANEAVAPKITAIEQENQSLKRSLANQRTVEVHRTLDGSVPNWREINKSPRFKQWLALTDLLAGSARGHLLNAAFKAADAPRVVAFFQAFVNDEAATGSTDFAPTIAPQPPASAPAPRQPVVALESLAAPGRAKPTAADTGKPADKPVFTRAQIATFYQNVRRGAYAGREAEKAAFEASIFEAQNEGRIRN